MVLLRALLLAFPPPCSVRPRLPCILGECLRAATFLGLGLSHVPTNFGGTWAPRRLTGLAQTVLKISLSLSISSPPAFFLSLGSPFTLRRIRLVPPLIKKAFFGQNQPLIDKVACSRAFFFFLPPFLVVTLFFLRRLIYPELM